MTQALLLVAWPYQGQVLTSFRYAYSYQLPPVYTGDAKLTQISSFVNDTHYGLTYRCQRCLAWNADGTPGKAPTSAGFLVLGRAQSKKDPTNAGCPNQISYGFHDNGYGQYGAPLDKVVNPSYSEWAALATKTVTGSCGAATSPAAPASSTSTVATSSVASTTSVATSAGPTTTPATTLSTTVSVPLSETTSSSVVSSAPASTSSAAPVASCAAIPPNQTYDYIIIGAGAGGIPLADRLSAAGHTVLLLEKGPPSSGRWGGTMKPEWLEGTNLTRFDVPGLCNQIWHDSTGIACTDTDQMAGCMLGGGTAVNAGLWWKVCNSRNSHLNVKLIIITAKSQGLGLQLPRWMAQRCYEGCHGPRFLAHSWNSQTINRQCSVQG